MVSASPSRPSIVSAPVSSFRMSFPLPRAIRSSPNSAVDVVGSQAAVDPIVAGVAANRVVAVAARSAFHGHRNGCSLIGREVLPDAVILVSQLDQSAADRHAFTQNRAGEHTRQGSRADVSVVESVTVNSEMNSPLDRSKTLPRALIVTVLTSPIPASKTIVSPWIRTSPATAPMADSATTMMKPINDLLLIRSSVFSLNDRSARSLIREASDEIGLKLR